MDTEMSLEIRVFYQVGIKLQVSYFYNISLQQTQRFATDKHVAHMMWVPTLRYPTFPEQLQTSVIFIYFLAFVINLQLLR